MEVRRNTNWCSAFEYPFIVTSKGKTIERFAYEDQAFSYVALYEAIEADSTQEVDEGLPWEEQTSQMGYGVTGNKIGDLK